MHLPIIQSPATGASLSGYLSHKRNYVPQKALLYGAILFRGWDVPTAASFETAVGALHLDSYDARTSAAPRTHVGGTVFTANDAPATEVIPFHHELGQSASPPATSSSTATLLPSAAERLRSPTAPRSPRTCGASTPPSMQKCASQG